MNLEPPEYISASQMSTLNRCQREWAIKYILRLPEESSDALAMGKSFHLLFEGASTEDVPLVGLNINEYPYRAALSVMHQSYIEVMSAYPPESCPEIKIERPGYLGFIDALVIYPDQTWWILERKTAGLIDEDKRFTLPANTQISAYVSHRMEICDAVFATYGTILDPDACLGVLYVQTVKPTERLKKSETLDEFAARLTSRTLVWELSMSLLSRSAESFDIAFAQAAQTKQNILKEYEKSRDVRRIGGNDAACKRFGKRCSYFATCYPNSL